MYMVVIGVIETFSSIALLMPVPEVERGVYILFATLMALAIYTHGVLDQYAKMVVPTCLFFTSIILYQTRSAKYV